MRAVRNFVLMLLVLGGAAAAGYFYWDYAYRWAPHAITKDQDEIAKVLDSSGWVSPAAKGGSGLKLYMIAYRGCDDCVRFEKDQVPALRKAGVDVRVIMIARADVNGQPKSTPGERSTVAELWVNRSWPLYEKWAAAPVDNWPAQGIAPADTDVARSAVVEAGRAAVDKLTPLLRENGVRFDYPVLVWWTPKGEMEGCACTDPHTDRFVAKDLGVKDTGTKDQGAS
jgi:hypothetical protein